MKSKPEKVLETFWLDIAEQNWRAAESVLTNDFIAEWPQSSERIVGPKNYIAINEFYGGTHKIEVLRVSRTDAGAVSEVAIESKMPDGSEQQLFALSFYELRDGKIARAREYWADHFPAPANRRQWVESAHPTDK